MVVGARLFVLCGLASSRGRVLPVRGRMAASNTGHHWTRGSASSWVIGSSTCAATKTETSSHFSAARELAQICEIRGSGRADPDRIQAARYRI